MITKRCTGVAAGGFSVFRASTGRNPVNAVVTHSNSAHMIKTIQKHQMQMSALDISKDGAMCLYGGGRPTSNQNLYIANFDDEAPPRKLTTHLKPVVFSSFLPSGDILSVGWDRQVLIVQPDGRTVAKRDGDSSSRYPSYALTRDGKNLIFGSKRGEIEILSFGDMTIVDTFCVEERGNQLWSLSLHPIKDLLLAGSASGEYSCWDLKTKSSLWFQKLEWGNHVRGVSWAPDGKSCAITYAPDGAAPRGSISRCVFVAGTTGKAKNEVTFGGPQPRCVTYNDDGTLVALGFGRSDAGGAPSKKNCFVKIVDVSSGEVLRSFDGHTDFVEQVKFRPGSSEVLSVSYDGSLRRWDYA